MTEEQLQAIKNAAEAWRGLNSNARYRSVGGTRLVKMMMEDAVPMMIGEIQRLQNELEEANG